MAKPGAALVEGGRIGAMEEFLRCPHCGFRIQGFPAQDLSRRTVLCPVCRAETPLGADNRRRRSPSGTWPPTSGSRPLRSRRRAGPSGHRADRGDGLAPGPLASSEVAAVVPGLTEGQAGPPAYEVRCIFCNRPHRSEFFDVIEEEILTWRDRAPEWQKGSLQTFEESQVRPISCETSALLGGFI